MLLSSIDYLTLSHSSEVSWMTFGQITWHCSHLDHRKLQVTLVMMITNRCQHRTSTAQHQWELVTRLGPGMVIHHENIRITGELLRYLYMCLPLCSVALVTHALCRPNTYSVTNLGYVPMFILCVMACFVHLNLFRFVLFCYYF